VCKCTQLMISTALMCWNSAQGSGAINLCKLWWVSWPSGSSALDFCFHGPISSSCFSRQFHITVFVLSSSKITVYVCISCQVEMFLENCLALFYCRGVDDRRFGRLLSSEKNCPAF
jgi:hypothetical protein